VIRLEGIVSTVLGEACEVECEGRTCPCVVRGKLKDGERRELHPVAVGDRVTIEVGADGKGAVTHVLLPRRSKLSRPVKGDRDLEQVVVANADQLLIVVATKRPAPRTGLIDRYMIAAENGLLDVVLCVNKIDLATADEYGELKDVYDRVGYRVVLTSATERVGLPDLVDALKGKFTVLAGPSGAGKSALINAIEPGLNLRVGRVSQATRKGRHTTTRVTRLPLSFGGWVADTPGVREFGLWDVLPEEIEGCFPEIAALVEGCKFPACSHRHEPDCAVMDAVEAGSIATWRYESYLRIRDYLETKRPYGRGG